MEPNKYCQGLLLRMYPDVYVFDCMRGFLDALPRFIQQARADVKTVLKAVLDIGLRTQVV